MPPVLLTDITVRGGVQLIATSPSQGLVPYGFPEDQYGFAAFQPVASGGRCTIAVIPAGRPVAMWCTDPNLTYYEKSDQFATLAGNFLTIRDDGIGGSIDIYDATDANGQTFGRIQVDPFGLKILDIKGADIIVEGQGPTLSCCAQLPLLTHDVNGIWAPANIYFNQAWSAGPIYIDGSVRLWDGGSSGFPANELMLFDVDAIHDRILRQMNSDAFYDRFTRLVCFVAGSLASKGHLVRGSTRTAPPWITVVSTFPFTTSQTLAHELGHTFGLDDVDTTRDLMYRDNTFGGTALERWQCFIANQCAGMANPGFY